MKKSRLHRERGFSLVELSIVLAIIGTIIAGIFYATTLARQYSKVEQSSEDVILVVDATRAAYGNAAYITGNTDTVVPFIRSLGALPAVVMRRTTTTCAGVTNIYADTPWGGTDVCGSLHICGWRYGATTACGTPSVTAQVQTFAVEFSMLDYGSCLAVASRISPTFPSGLKNVYINSVDGLAGSGTLPVTSTFAATNCAAGSTNKVSFVYLLRAPIT